MRRALVGLALAGVLAGCVNVATPAAAPGSDPCAAAVAFHDEVLDISYRTQAGVTQDQYMELVGIALAHHARIPAGCVDEATETAFAAYLFASTRWSLCLLGPCTITGDDLQFHWQRAAKALASPVP